MKDNKIAINSCNNKTIKNSLKAKKIFKFKKSTYIKAIIDLFNLYKC